MHLRLVWIMSIEVLVKVLMDERSEWAKVRDELYVMFTTMFMFTTMAMFIFCLAQDFDKKFKQVGGEKVSF